MDAGSNPVLCDLYKILFLLKYPLFIEYIYISVFVIISLTLSIIILALSYLLAFQNYDIEKLSAYECGFQPFEDARNKFDIKFYLVGILFIIFDLEVSFLFPWSIALKSLDVFGYWIMFYFLLILTIGFIYEWLKGALNWD